MRQAKPISKIITVRPGIAYWRSASEIRALEKRRLKGKTNPMPKTKDPFTIAGRTKSVRDAIAKSVHKGTRPPGGTRPRHSLNDPAPANVGRYIPTDQVRPVINTVTIQLLNLDGEKIGEPFTTAFDVAHGSPDILLDGSKVYMRVYASTFADLNGPKVYKQARAQPIGSQAEPPTSWQRAQLIKAARHPRGFWLTNKSDPKKQVMDHCQGMVLVAAGWLVELPRGGFMITDAGRKVVKR